MKALLCLGWTCIAIRSFSRSIPDCAVSTEGSFDSSLLPFSDISSGEGKANMIGRRFPVSSLICTKYSALVVHIFFCIKKTEQIKNVSLCYKYTAALNQTYLYHGVKVNSVSPPACLKPICVLRKATSLSRKTCIVLKLRNINYLQSFFVKRFIKF